MDPRLRKGALALILTLLVIPDAFAQLCGDCDGNTQLSILDALRGAQFGAGLIPPGPPTPADFLVCDVNNNGNIEILDALLMAQAAAGLPVTLRCPAACGTTAPFIDADYIALQTASPPECRDLTIPFTLTDPDSDVCMIVVEFSTDAGTTWRACTRAPGSAALTGLASSPAGTLHTFIWDSDDPADLGAVTVANVQVRMTVSDCLAGNTDRSLPGFTVANGNSAPIVAISTPAPAYALHGTVNISYFIFDNESDTCSITAEASTDAGTTWQMAAMGGGGSGTTGLASAPLGVVHVFAWDVDNTYAPGWSAASVRLRITAHDCGTGSGDTRIFPAGAGCQPTQAPPATQVTSALSGLIFAGSVPVTYTVSDANSDLVDVVFRYSTDNGLSFPAGQICTQAAGDSTTNIPATPGGISRSFTWAAATDLGGGVHMNLRLQLSPSDFCGAGTPEIAPPLAMAPFEVGCPPGMTTAPSISVTTVLSGMTFTGAIPVSFNVIDGDSHPVDVLVQYSTDNGTTFATATLTGPNPVLGLTSSPGGTAAMITWDTSIDLPLVLSSTTRLRFTPTDFCQAGTPVLAPAMASPPFTVDNTVAGFGPGFFVCNSNNSTVYFVSVATPTVISDTIVLPAGAAPFDMVIDPVMQHRLYVLCEDRIFIIDANTHDIIDANPGGGGPSDPIAAAIMTGEPCATFSPQQLEISPDGLFLYCMVYNCSGGFNLFRVSTTGPMYAVTWNRAQGLFPDVPGEFALSPDGSRIVTLNNNNYDTDCGVASGCPQVNAAGCVGLPCPSFGLIDCCNTDSVSFVNASTGAVINSINNMGNNPLWAAFDASGSNCYVTEFGYLDLCQDAIFCDILGEEIHRYDTSGATMVAGGPIPIPCPVCGVGGSSAQEGSFPGGIYRVPGRELMYITDAANELGNMAVLNTALNAFESTVGEPLGCFTPMMTGWLQFAPHHVGFDTVRELAYVVVFDQANSGIVTINYGSGTLGGRDVTRDVPFGAFGFGGITGIAVKE